MMNRLVVLMGLPGSGKSTLALSKEFEHYEWINQDTLGDRGKCISAAAKALAGGMNVVIDRCNVTKEQRAFWVRLANDYAAQITCIFLVVDPEECLYRINLRKNHPTIKEDLSVEKKRDIIANFFKSVQLPSLDEGFHEVTFRRN